MSARQLNIVCDTNVWLDAFIPSRPRCQTVRDLLVCAREQEHNLLYSGHELPDVFFEIAREAKSWFRSSGREVDETYAAAARSHAWACIQDMHEVATAIASDEAAIWYALKLRGFNEDLEDNLVLAACERVHADYLVTSDRQLQRKAPLAALDPADMLALLETGLSTGAAFGQREP